MIFKQPLDAVISGYAYELATTTIGVLGEGKSTKKWISTTMLCTLDNFVKAVLFNERIFLTGCADLAENHFVPREAKSGLSKNGRRLMDEADIFHPEPSSQLDSEAVEQRVRKALDPIDISTHPLFTVECGIPHRGLTIFQELVYLDVYFIEYAIERFGAEHFKAVFPGEQVYLGLRSKRLPIPQASETMADIPGRRLRACIRSKMEEMNQFVVQGSRQLPVVLPIFVAGIMRQCQSGADFVPALLDARDSAAMRRLRRWMVRCSQLGSSSNLADREKAAAALTKLKAFDPNDDISRSEFLVSVLRIIKSVFLIEPAEILLEVASPMVKLFLGAPFSALGTFGGRNIESSKFDAFLIRTFGDQFNRNEMDFISNLLRLPDTLAEWSVDSSELSVAGVRHDSSAPPLARPCFIASTAPADVENAEDDFARLWDKAEKVTPEMLRKWDEESGHKPG
jgi:hypothetical protein